MKRNVITLIFTMKKAGLWKKNMDLIQAAEIPRALYSVIFSCFVALPVLRGASVSVCGYTRAPKTLRCMEEDYSSLLPVNRRKGSEKWAYTGKAETGGRKTKELITDISHQLKNPLASLKMSYELADTGCLISEERQSFLQQGLAGILSRTSAGWFPSRYPVWRQRK